MSKIKVTIEGEITLPTQVKNVFNNMTEAGKKEFMRSISFMIMDTLDMGDGVKYHGTINVREE